MERTGRPVVASGQELNVGNAQIRTLLDRQKEKILAECQAEIKKHELQANYDRRSVQQLSEMTCVFIRFRGKKKKKFIALKQKNFNDEIKNFSMHSYYSKTQNYVKLIINVSMKGKN